MITATGLSKAALTEKPYHWRGIPDWNPYASRQDQPRTPPPRSAATDAHNRQQQAQRETRMAEFARLRDRGLTVPEAARKMGISRSAGWRYDRDLRDRAAGQAGQ